MRRRPSRYTATARPKIGLRHLQRDISVRRRPRKLGTCCCESLRSREHKPQRRHSLFYFALHVAVSAALQKAVDRDQDGLWDLLGHQALSSPWPQHCIHSHRRSSKHPRLAHSQGCCIVHSRSTIFSSLKLLESPSQAYVQHCFAELPLYARRAGRPRVQQEVCDSLVGYERTLNSPVRASNLFA